MERGTDGARKDVGCWMAEMEFEQMAMERGWSVEDKHKMEEREKWKMGGDGSWSAKISESMADGI